LADQSISPRLCRYRPITTKMSKATRRAATFVILSVAPGILPVMRLYG
jgi:hypothetical protein